MAARYFVAAQLSNDRRAAIRAAVQSAGTDRILLDQPGLIAITEAATPAIDLAEHGFILGRLHTAGRRSSLTDLSSDTIAAIAASRGGHLIRAYWGDYLAVIRSTGSEAIDLLRAPLGALPCLYAWVDEAWVVASDLEYLARLGGYQPRVDWEQVLRFALAPDVRFPETCLEGLRELQGGDRLALGDAGTRTLWSPWRFAESARRLDDPIEARQRLHDTILSSMGSALDSTARSVILLSGGLDSSIVSATAAMLGLDVECLTISTAARSGDERGFARATAHHLGLPLTEGGFELEAVDLDRSGAAHLPRPVARAFEWEARRQSQQLARAKGCDATLSGGGGDNIFCALQSVAPAVDALTEIDGRREFWRVARELSALTGASLPAIAWRARRRSWQPGRPYPKPVDAQFLAPAAAAVGRTMPRHPWLQRPNGVPQGKGAHVAAMLGVQSLTEDTDPLDPLALRFPLLAQPIVETCLRLPTWLWYDKGCNRAVARHAFAGLLPPDIAWRRSKGTPDSFVVELFDTRRAQIREMLCAGRLANAGLLDIDALRRVLDDPRPVRGTDHGRVMRLLDIEAWTRCWPG